MARSLDKLIAALEQAQPADRIALRDEVLGHGGACISPLDEAVGRRPELANSVAAWLERLATTKPETRDQVVRTLKKLSRGPEGGVAREALSRLGAPAAARGEGPRGPRRSLALEAVYERIIAAAKEGRVLTYEQLETNRGHVGKFLHTIALDEAAAERPPLTALVVSKTNGQPGDGFLPAMEEIGYARPGESAKDVWARAMPEVHAYWQDPARS
jgi:hypothetical protein